MLGLSMSQIWALLMRGFWSGGHKNSVWAGSGQEWQMKPGYSDRLFFFWSTIYLTFLNQLSTVTNQFAFF